MSWLQHEIALVYRNLLFQAKSFLQKLPTKKIARTKNKTGTFHVYYVAPSTPYHTPPPIEYPPPPLLHLALLDVGETTTL